MTTYYVDAAAANDAGTGAIGSPKKYITSGLALLSSSGGDTLIIKDGTYSHANDAIARGTTIGYGAAGVYNTIQAETDGGVTITQTLGLPLAATYLSFEGLKWSNQTAGGKEIVGNHLKFKRCAFKGGATTGNNVSVSIGTNDQTPGAQYILMEDCWVYGAGGRYKLLVFNSQYVILRRCLVRHDGGWTYDGSNPQAGITLYNSRDCIVQNPIIIDCDQTYTGWGGGFYMVHNNSATTTNQDNIIRGYIGLNFGANSAMALDDINAITGITLNDFIFWSANSGLSTNTSSHTLTATRGTVGDMPTASVGRAFATYGSGGASGTVVDVTNTIIRNADQDYRINIGTITHTYNNVSATTTTATPGTGSTTYSPFANGLTYLPRIEAGSTLKTAGVSGGQVGAQIMTKWGTSGTLYGESGYDTDSGVDLWPWPYEARIKTDLSEDAVTRGFCTTGNQLDGATQVTLTSYIWEFLGNQMPGSIYGSPVITGGTAAPAHLSTGNTVTGTSFDSAQGSGGLVIGGAAQTETAWADTSITYTADRGINGNGIAVNAVVTDSAGLNSANYALTGFQPPAGWSYVTLTSVWPVAVERVQSSADLAIGNQIEWDDPTISIDASGVPTWPPGTPDGYTFNFRVWVDGDGWGATEVATLNPASSGSGDNTRRLSIGLGIGL